MSSGKGGGWFLLFDSPLPGVEAYISGLLQIAQPCPREIPFVHSSAFNSNLSLLLRCLRISRSVVSMAFLISKPKVVDIAKGRPIVSRAESVACGL